MSYLITLTQNSTGSSTHCNKARKRNKMHSEGNKDRQVSLFAEHTIVYWENPKESTKKDFLELVSELSKDAGYKINIKYQLHFYILIMNKWKPK